MLPNTIQSGHGCDFDRVLHQEDIEYEGRVTWADSDQWERPDWTYDFVDGLRQQYKDYDIRVQKGDKGWLHIYFRPFNT